MNLDVNVKAVCKIDIDPAEVFRLLCKALDMEFVLDEDTNYFVVKNDFDDVHVAYIKDGHDEYYDDRGNLFIALRNLAVEIFPNVGFRNDNYIYRIGEM